MNGYKKTVQEHIVPFGKKFCEKWGRKALIDLHYSLETETMDSGLSVISHIFSELRDCDCSAVPVCGLESDKSLLKDIKSIIKQDKHGVCFRFKLEELMKPSFNTLVEDLMKSISVTREEVDLVIDLGKPESFTPYDIFSKALVVRIKRIENINEYRSFILSATSLRLSEIKRPGGEIERHEWLLYKQLINDIGEIRSPTFGDYTIETPEFINQDMRKIKPAGKIVYTSDDVWFVTKGTAYRDNPAQMKEHCEAVVRSGHFCGVSYSHGDKRINNTMIGKENTGNLSTWKQVGVNHHITKVSEQLASFHGT
ncbi:beta family protein [methane-oxidizing endosymbiont of Gigantopelta aegis]|uniref:beta family protein n=1 Tax=methane-oxidizing endosymbiont of Gigantopelta aegis TaxID=2794938 RepID=UPI001BE4010C|nr:beta family protein [methane-oxidizing endosymbiont of Gigantopelta aegis]